MAVYKDNATGTWRVILSFHKLERGAEADPETGICYEAGSTGVGA